MHDTEERNYFKSRAAKDPKSSTQIVTIICLCKPGGVLTVQNSGMQQRDSLGLVHCCAARSAGRWQPPTN
eukprot:5855263-Amphidinium_carterae.1